ncbi:GntR family transcriptional regulator [soil metagenome]
MRTLRYQEVAGDLRRQLEADELAAGRLLPSEADLSARYKASRVTVRRALDLLRDEGLVDSRQGFGWFVAADPLRQPLVRLATIEGQLAESGLSSERMILEFGVVPAPPRARQVLGVETVLRVTRLNLADGEPFARVTVWCPEELAAGLTREQVTERSFYDVLDVEVGGATQTIGAAAASPEDAALLAIPKRSPVLVCERVTSDETGAPVLVGVYVFPAHRTEFIVDLPRAEASIAPSGLRLVD